jgi:hypothetical protein
MPSESNDSPPNYSRRPLVFVAVDSTVMKGSEQICVARSPNMAQRIAHALNHYFNPRYNTAAKKGTP